MRQQHNKWAELEFVHGDIIHKSFMTIGGDWVIETETGTIVTLLNSHDGILPYTGSEVVFYAHLGESEKDVLVHGVELNQELLYYSSPEEFERKFK